MEFIEGTANHNKYSTFCSCDVCMKEHLFVQRGWECPKCGLINAPFMSYCPCSKMSLTCCGSERSSSENKDLSKQIEKLEEVCTRTDLKNPSDGEKESGI